MLLTTVHTVISLAAVVLGVGAVARMFGYPLGRGWTTWFIATAVATTATGFLFPFIGVTPAFAVGIVAGLILVAVLLARYRHAHAGAWGTVYVLGMIASLYLLVFVTIAQAFDKIGFLHVLAPTGSEPAFAVAQLVCLAVFVVLGYLAVRRPGPMATI
jgi:hypothetical protein